MAERSAPSMQVAQYPKLPPSGILPNPPKSAGLEGIKIAVGDLHLNGPAVRIPVQLDVPIHEIRRLSTKGPRNF
jgi:hypothetical protein